jgi:hypothetical protein
MVPTEQISPMVHAFLQPPSPSKISVSNDLIIIAKPIATQPEDDHDREVIE